jgi:PAS domain S-box-containing protein
LLARLTLRMRIALATTAIVVLLIGAFYLDRASPSPLAVPVSLLAVLPLAVTIAVLVTRGPSRSVRLAAAFAERLPNDIGSQVDERGHTAELRRLMRALNRASSLLAAQQERLAHLSDESRRFASVVQHTHVGLVLSDRQGAIEWANDGFVRLTGWPVATLVGQTPRAALRSVGRDPSTLSSMAAHVRNGEAFTADILALCGDGRRRWLRVDGEPVRDASGNVIGFMSLHTDAEGRMQALREMRRGQTLYRAVANASRRLLRTSEMAAVAPAVLTDVGEACGASRLALYALGSEGGGASCISEWDAGSGATAAVDEHAFVRWTATVGAGETIMVASDHTPEANGAGDGTAVVPVHVRGSWWGYLTVQGAGGVTAWSETDRLAFRAAADAIAAAVERDQINDDLERERSFASQVLAGVMDGVAVTDPAGLVVYANAALGAILGLPPGDLTGRRIDEFVGAATGEDSVAWLGSADGIQVQLGGRTLLIRGDDERARADNDRRIIVMVDITDVIRLQEDLRLALTAAEAASEAKSRFLARVSHELRTPLNAVLGYSQLAALDAEAPAIVDALEQIQRAGSHLGRVIDDLIDVAGAESGELKVRFDSVDLADAAEEALRMGTPLAAQRDVTLRSELQSGVLVVADRGRLVQVALNLLSNAVKYGSPGGRVVLRVARDEETMAGRLEVVDSGPGIAADDVERLFRPFERLSNAGETSGTGIGLALSRVLIERMGGHINVESTVGVGTRFSVTLPAMQAVAGAAQSPSR